MQQALIDEIAKFILYLENVDGESWNSLMRDLSATYEARQGLMFYGLGIERCYAFADRWFGQYWYSFCPQEIKYDFRRHQTSVSLFAAAEILSGAEKEFKIGNFFSLIYMTTAQMTTIKNPTALALVEAMLETSTDDFDTPLSQLYSPAEVRPESVERLYLEFQRFVEMVEPEIANVTEREWSSLDEFYLDSRPDNPTELYFVYTRNYEGEGFWNTGKWDESVSRILSNAAHSFPEIVACLDENGRIYFV